MHTSLRYKSVINGFFLELSVEEAQILSSVLAQYCSDFKRDTFASLTAPSYRLAEVLRDKLLLKY